MPLVTKYKSHAPLRAIGLTSVSTAATYWTLNRRERERKRERDDLLTLVTTEVDGLAGRHLTAAMMAAYQSKQNYNVSEMTGIKIRPTTAN
jgi:hypothetical protein